MKRTTKLSEEVMIVERNKPREYMITNSKNVTSLKLTEMEMKQLYFWLQQKYEPHKSYEGGYINATAMNDMFD